MSPSRQAVRLLFMDMRRPRRNGGEMSPSRQAYYGCEYLWW